MGTFAVDQVTNEIEQRLNQGVTLARQPLKEDDANNQFVDLLATVELINRYATSELLSTGQPPKAGAVTQSFSVDVITRLKKWVAQIREIVLKLAHALHAVSWSLSVAFPWGVSLTLIFAVPNP